MPVRVIGGASRQEVYLLRKASVDTVMLMYLTGAISSPVVIELTAADLHCLEKEVPYGGHDALYGSDCNFDVRHELQRRRKDLNMYLDIDDIVRMHGGISPIPFPWSGRRQACWMPSGSISCS